MLVFISTIERFAGTPRELLDAKHAEEFQRATNPKRRAELTAGAGLLRHALIEYGTTLDDSPLPIEYTEEGKPYLHSGPHFSLSHSGEFIACAVDDSEIGIDVERVSRFEKTRITRKMLTPKEQEHFENIYDPGKKARYLAIKWTGKEAIAKLIGKGLGVSFSELSEDNYTMHTYSFVSGNASMIVRTASEK